MRLKIFKLAFCTLVIFVLNLCAVSFANNFKQPTITTLSKQEDNNNVTADGIAESKMLQELEVSKNNKKGNQIKRTKQTKQYSAADIDLLAKVISAEARGEPYSGQVAVGAVILNRIGHPSFPDTLSGVIYQPGAFSCITDGQINAPVVDSAKKAAIDATNGSDPSGGAIYYYNPAKTTNSYMLSRPVITVIGDHKFCS